MTELMQKQRIRRRSQTRLRIRAPLLIGGAQERIGRRGPHGKSLAARLRELSIPYLVPVGLLVLLVAGSAVAIAFFGRESLHLPRSGVALPRDSQLASILTSRGIEPVPAAGPTAAVGSAPATISPKPVEMTPYVVKRGDTLAGIAASKGLNDETLISVNDIENVRSLFPGRTIRIPSRNGVSYRVQKGDSLQRIANAYGIKLTDILDSNDLQSQTILPNQELFLPGAHMSPFEYRRAIGSLFIYPTMGVLTSPFGMRPDPFTGVVTFHNGVDLANSIGTRVNAAMDGRVVFLGTNRAYGNFILIDHGGGYQTLYGHLSKWIASKGQYVHAGEEIGLMGDTGYSTGPHLHFTIYKNSVPVNPLTYLTTR